MQWYRVHMGVQTFFWSQRISWISNLKFLSIDKFAHFHRFAILWATTTTSGFPCATTPIASWWLLRFNVLMCPVKIIFIWLVQLWCFIHLVLTITFWFHVQKNLWPFARNEVSTKTINFQWHHQLSQQWSSRNKSFGKRIMVSEETPIPYYWTGWQAMGTTIVLEEATIILVIWYQSLFWNHYPFSKGFVSSWSLLQQLMMPLDRKSVV